MQPYSPQSEHCNTQPRQKSSSWFCEQHLHWTPSSSTYRLQYTHRVSFSTSESELLCLGEEERLLARCGEDCDMDRDLERLGDRDLERLRECCFRSVIKNL